MSLVFENIHHSYNGQPALTEVNLTAAAGEIVCLLGQSGCGKTTLLNLAAGILPLQSGKIRLNDKLLASPLNQPPPEKRPVGLVFQEGALFPHLTVAQNIAFGVRGASNTRLIVTTLLDQIGLSDYGQRYPHTLSGGQRQRVAVARALAPKPEVLLMDEPFANIDIMLRRHLREETRRMLKARDCVTILVTHDPEEAIEISDKIAIMDQGRIIQYGTAEELYNSPVSLTSALLTGDGAILKASRNQEELKTPFGKWPIDCLKLNDFRDDTVFADVVIRPYAVSLTAAGRDSVVSDLRSTGHSQLVTLRASCGQSITVEIDAQSMWSVGQSVSLVPKKQSLFAFAT
jgi:iron(III) transport system ATP-binding protein|tara:strand:- start:2197 stop:3231 length:1035 start_codon:yes stop_codon:yes gene_type:complete